MDFMLLKNGGRLNCYIHLFHHIGDINEMIIDAELCRTTSGARFGFKVVVEIEDSRSGVRAGEEVGGFITNVLEKEE